MPFTIGEIPIGSVVGGELVLRDLTFDYGMQELAPMPTNPPRAVVPLDPQGRPIVSPSAGVPARPVQPIFLPVAPTLPGGFAAPFSPVSPIQDPVEYLLSSEGESSKIGGGGSGGGGGGGGGSGGAGAPPTFGCGTDEGNSLSKKLIAGGRKNEEKMLTTRDPDGKNQWSAIKMGDQYYTREELWSKTASDLGFQSAGFGLCSSNCENISQRVREYLLGQGLGERVYIDKKPGGIGNECYEDI
jgi:hypothetical protein